MGTPRQLPGPMSTKQQLRPVCPGHGMINENRNSYEIDMKISERGQITIPKELRDRFGMNKDVEVEITPTKHGLLIQKRTAAQHPVEKISGILDRGVDVDRYIEEIRGR
ncbi:MAG: AbrB/MazE/SpoVT family DNA-binding domain-containing protein [Caldilineaceae bacterium SB0666_bin_21]|nr:AbrB/MazE/SpoVT family DNA-binding domain-containing protein [Caldilineaceae bacterium SB0666_bin_21]